MAVLGTVADAQAMLSYAMSRLGKNDDETVMTFLRAAMAILNIERSLR